MFVIVIDARVQTGLTTRKAGVSWLPLAERWLPISRFTCGWIYRLLDLAWPGSRTVDRSGPRAGLRCKRPMGLKVENSCKLKSAQCFRSTNYSIEHTDITASGLAP